MRFSINRAAPSSVPIQNVRADRASTPESFSKAMRLHSAGFNSAVVSNQSVIRAEPQYAARVFSDGVDAIGRQAVKERYRSPTVQIEGGVISRRNWRRTLDICLSGRWRRILF